MIPAINEILAMLITCQCTREQASDWIDRHLELAADPGTLRDHFAGLAMQGAVANPTGANGFTFAQRADWAYQQADAMLEARGAAHG